MATITHYIGWYSEKQASSRPNSLQVYKREDGSKVEVTHVDWQPPMFDDVRRIGKVTEFDAIATREAREKRALQEENN